MGETVSYWITEKDVLGRVRLAASGTSLCKLALGRESDDDFFGWLRRALPLHTPVQECTTVISHAMAEIDAYLAGRLRVFRIRLDLRGTPFQRQVWSTVGGVPYGVTVTYSEIAARMGRPTAVRAVGAANGANPLPLFIPCHRVVGADGTLRGYGGGLAVKVALLHLEGAPIALQLAAEMQHD